MFMATATKSSPQPIGSPAAETAKGRVSTEGPRIARHMLNTAPASAHVLRRHQRRQEDEEDEAEEEGRTGGSFTWSFT